MTVLLTLYVTMPSLLSVHDGSLTATQCCPRCVHVCHVNLCVLVLFYLFFFSVVLDFLLFCILVYVSVFCVFCIREPASARKTKVGMVRSVRRWTRGCAGKTVKSLDNVCRTGALLQWGSFAKGRFKGGLHQHHLTLKALNDGGATRPLSLLTADKEDLKHLLSSAASYRGAGSESWSLMS